MTAVPSRRLLLDGEQATEAVAVRLAAALRDGGFLALAGDLGAGKSTLARALLRAMGVSGRIRSPTYALLESYSVPDLAIAHVDLYRLGGPDELEPLGLREWLAPGHLLLVEWPERAGRALPVPDLSLQLDHVDATRRQLTAVAHGPRGLRWLQSV